MGDVEDPELYAGFPLGEFMQTDKGLWIKTYCTDPQYVIRPDPANWGHRVVVYGEVEDRLATEYFLKWGQ